MVEQHFCLRWNNYRTNITSEFEVLREDQQFVDVTLACEGHQLKAHKVVLSACSPYFKHLLQGNPCTHPIIILRDVDYLHMRGLLQFMYAGEVNVSQAHLAAFLHTAEALKVRGLAEAPQQDQRAATAAAVAAAAVNNSVADLLALKSSIGNLPLGPLASTLSKQHLSSHQNEPKNLQFLHLSRQSPYNFSENSSDTADKKETKPQLCSAGANEPIPLTLNNNVKPKDLRSPSPGQRKRVKSSHPGEGSGPNSPQSYYVPNTLHSNGSTGDTPSEDIAHDLSNTSKQIKNLTTNSNTVSMTTVSHSIAVSSSASHPPLLLPPSSPDAMQITLKTELIDGSGGGSDHEGVCGESWHEDSVGSDGECKVGGSSLLPPPQKHLQHSPPFSSPPHASSLMMASLPKQESHLAGLIRSFEPLPCPVCKRSYSSPGNLKQHIENIHMANIHPGFECKICNNKFKSKWYLHKHLHRAHHIRGRKDP